MGSCDQTWSSGEGYEDQDPGGNLSVFSANQGTKIDMKVKFIFKSPVMDFEVNNSSAHAFLFIFK